jgi:hypothetical protein
MNVRYVALASNGAKGNVDAEEAAVRHRSLVAKGLPSKDTMLPPLSDRWWRRK